VVTLPLTRDVDAGCAALPGVSLLLFFQAAAALFSPEKILRETLSAKLKY